ncbi:MAG: hypothetical protein ACHQIM_20490 [Sphingobacteriales bacterium]
MPRLIRLSFEGGVAAASLTAFAGSQEFNDHAKIAIAKIMINANQGLKDKVNKSSSNFTEDMYE